MSDEDELESDFAEEFTIDPDAIWATRAECGMIRVYLNENQTFVFSEEAAECLVKALGSALARP